MAQNYRVIDVPGLSKLKMSVTDTSKEEEVFSQTPEWMVKMDDVFEHGAVDGYANFTELFGWTAKYSRHTSGNLGSGLFTSATLKHSELALCIPQTGDTVKLESKMNKGEEILLLEIVRLGNIKEVKVKLQHVKYGVARIQSIQPDLDRVFIVFTVSTRENTVFTYDNSGSSTGQLVTKVDYVKNTAE